MKPQNLEVARDRKQIRLIETLNYRGFQNMLRVIGTEKKIDSQKLRGSEVQNKAVPLYIINSSIKY